MNRSDLKDHGISALFGAVSTVSTMAAVFGGAAVVFGGAAVVFGGAAVVFGGGAVGAVGVATGAALVFRVGAGCHKVSVNLRENTFIAGMVGAVVFAGATAANFYDKDIPQSFACSGATFEINDDGNTVTPKLPAGCTMAPK